MLKDELNKELFQDDSFSRNKVNALAKKYHFARYKEKKLAYRDEILVLTARFIKKVICSSPVISPDDIDDVFNTAVLNFYRCLDLYKPTKAGFVTYLYFWVRKSIINHCYERNIIKIKNGAFSKKDKSNLQANMARNSSLVYLDWTPTDNDSEDARSLHEVIPSGHDTEAEVHGSISSEQFLKFVQERLDPKEFVVIKYRYLVNESWALDDFSEVLHLSRERVRHIEARALYKLRKILKNQMVLNFGEIKYRHEDAPEDSVLEAHAKFLSEQREQKRLKNLEKTRK